MKPQTRTATIAIAYALGMLACEYFPPVVYVTAACVAAVAGLVFAKRYLTSETVVLVTALFLAGAFRYGAYMTVASDDVSRFTDSASAVRGRVASEPEVKGDRVTMMLAVSQVRLAERWVDCSGRTMIYQRGPGRDVKLQYGETAQIVARLWKPSPATNPGQFDLARYLARQRVYCCASAKKPDTVQVLRKDGGSPLVKAALAAKNAFVAAIFKIHPPREASVIAGMALGTYAYLPEDLYTAFQRTGTMHLLAASGTNCFILCTLALLVLWKVHAVPRNMIMITLIVFYASMLGWPPSLVRAGTMTSVALMALPLRRSCHIKNVFFVSAFILLIFRPPDLFNIGFQLSYLAVWGLIAAAPLIEKWLSSQRPQADTINKVRKASLAWGRVSGVSKSAAVATLACTLFTAPVGAFYFNYISLTSLPANIAMAFVSYLVFADAMVSAILAHVPIVGPAWGWIGTKMTGAMLSMVEALGKPSWIAMLVSSPSVWWIVTYYAILVVLASRFEVKNGRT